MTKRGENHSKKAAEQEKVVLDHILDESPEAVSDVFSFTDALSQAEQNEVVKEDVVEVHVVTFTLDQEEYGVPITKVREIIRVSEITQIPKAPRHICGVTNLRGKIVPVVEIRTLLGLSESALAESTRIVLVETKGRLLGILVDAVTQVLRIPVSSVSKPPQDVVNANTDCIIGVAQLAERLVILLDLDKALEAQSQK